MSNQESAEKFQRASIIEREYLQRLGEKLSVDAIIPQPNTSPFDAVFLKGNLSILVEAKVRNYTHDAFDTTLVEMPKYRGLLKLLQQGFTKHAIYVEFYSKDQVALIFDLTKIPEPEWTRETFVKNSVVDNGKIVKAVGYLDKKLAKKIQL